MKCLDRNNYDKAKCKEFFQTYTECKKAWVGAFLYLFQVAHIEPAVFTVVLTKPGTLD